MDRKALFRERFGRIVALLGYKFSPHEELVNHLLDPEKDLERK